HWGSYLAWWDASRGRASRGGVRRLCWFVVVPVSQRLGPIVFLNWRGSMGSNVVRIMTGVVATVLLAAPLTVSLQAQRVAAAESSRSDAGAALVSIEVREMPLKQVLRTIAQQAGLTP